MQSVLLGSDLFGDSYGVVISVTPQAMEVAMCYLPPMGTVLRVEFAYTVGHREVKLVAKARVHGTRLLGREELRVVWLRFMAWLYDESTYTDSTEGGLHEFPLDQQ